MRHLGRTVRWSASLVRARGGRWGGGSVAILASALLVIVGSVLGLGGCSGPRGGIATLDWVRLFGSERNDGALAVAVDGGDRVYVTGYADGALPGAVSGGGSDAYLIRLDRDGNLTWVRQFGSSDSDAAPAVAIDAAGDVYVAGGTDGSMNGDPNTRTHDLFVAKFDGSGNLMWVTQFGDVDFDEAFGIAADASDAVYVAGSSYHVEYPETNVALLARLDREGNLEWLKQFRGSGDVGAAAVTVDAAGDVYIVGSTAGDLAGFVNAGGIDAFLAKYDGDGNQLWIRQLAGTDDDVGTAVVTDASGAIYVAGGTQGKLIGLTSGSGVAFLAKYDSDGNRLWVRQYGDERRSTPDGLAVDATGHVFATGAQFPPFGSDPTSAAIHIYVAKYDGTGTERWWRQIGSSSSDMASGVAIGSDGGIYVSGSTFGVFSGQVRAGGLFDAFVARLAP